MHVTRSDFSLDGINPYEERRTGSAILSLSLSWFLARPISAITGRTCKSTWNHVRHVIYPPLLRAPLGRDCYYTGRVLTSVRAALIFYIRVREGANAERYSCRALARSRDLRHNLAGRGGRSRCKIVVKNWPKRTSASFFLHLRIPRSIACKRFLPHRWLSVSRELRVVSDFAPNTWIVRTNYRSLLIFRMIRESLVTLRAFTISR